MNASVRRTRAIVARVVLAVAGGYVLTVAISMLMARIFALFLARGEASVLSAMLAFLVYLGVLLWAFSETRVGRLAGVMAVGVVAVIGFSFFGPWMS